MEMMEIGYEFTFPLCEHKEKGTLTTRNGKRGVENVYKSMIEKHDGLCGKCYRESNKK